MDPSSTKKRFCESRWNVVGTNSVNSIEIPDDVLETAVGIYDITDCLWVAIVASVFPSQRRNDRGNAIVASQSKVEECLLIVCVWGNLTNQIAPNHALQISK